MAPPATLSTSESCHAVLGCQLVMGSVGQDATTIDPHSFEPSSVVAYAGSICHDAMKADRDNTNILRKEFLVRGHRKTRSTTSCIVLATPRQHAIDRLEGCRKPRTMCAHATSCSSFCMVRAEHSSVHGRVQTRPQQCSTRTSTRVSLSRRRLPKRSLSRPSSWNPGLNYPSRRPLR